MCLADHIEFLEERIFQTRTKWPHFQRMLDDLKSFADDLLPRSEVVILERAYIYGGVSLFSPIFGQHNVIAIDCEIPTTDQRRGYQKSWTNDPRCIKAPATKTAPANNTKLPNSSVDALLIPNVVHHEPDQEGMFAEFSRILKPGGVGYIFEALLRELHQIPDDYVRYTPWGFKSILAKYGLNMTEWRPAGGPFEAIAYCWTQALQYLPENERIKKESWFYKKHFPELIVMDKKYRENICREHTSFPIGYSIYFEKLL